MLTWYLSVVVALNCSNSFKFKRLQLLLSLATRVCPEPFLKKAKCGTKVLNNVVQRPGNAIFPWNFIGKFIGSVYFIGNIHTSTKLGSSKILARELATPLYLGAAPRGLPIKIALPGFCSVGISFIEPKAEIIILSRASGAGSPTNRPGDDKTRDQRSLGTSTGGPDQVR